MIKMIVIIIIHELLVNSKCGDYYQGVWSHMKFDKVSKFGHLSLFSLSCENRSMCPLGTCFFLNEVASSFFFATRDST